MKIDPTNSDDVRRMPAVLVRLESSSFGKRYTTSTNLASRLSNKDRTVIGYIERLKGTGTTAADNFEDYVDRVVAKADMCEVFLDRLTETEREIIEDEYT